MIMKKYPLLVPLNRKATSSSAFTVKFPRFQTSGVIVVDGFSCRNDVRNNSWCSVGIQRGGRNYFIETLDMTEKEKYFTTTHSFVMKQDDVVVVRIEEHGNGDTFSMLLQAHFEEYESEDNG